MYIRLAWREFKNNLFMRIIIIVQMAVVFFCALSASSIVIYFYNYYNNFSKYFDAEGILYHTDSIVLQGRTLAESSEELEQQLKHTEVISCYMPWVTYTNRENSEVVFYPIAYDKEFVEGYTPKLSEGRWLSTERKDGVVEAVISENAYGLQVGDVLHMYDTYMQQPEQYLEVEIVGELPNGGRFVGYTNDSRQNVNDYRCVYADFYSEEEEMPLILMSIDNINMSMEARENHSIERMMTGLMFVRFLPEITEEERVYNERILEDTVRIVEKSEMDVIRRNSHESIKERIYAILPIFLCVFILTVISAASSCAITVKKQMKNYTIYGICGMPWGKSVVITVLDCLYTAVIGMVVCVLFVKTAHGLAWLGSTMVELGGIQLGCMFAVGVLYIILSAGMPYILISGTSLVDELRREQGD